MATSSTRDLARMAFTIHSTAEGRWQNDEIKLAAQQETVRALDRVVDRLDRILGQIASLGNDGIHTAIRHAAKKARRVEKRERAKRKAARQR